MIDAARVFFRQQMGRSWRAGRLLRRDPQAAGLVLRMGAWVIIVSLLIKICPLPRLLRLVTLHPRRSAEDHTIPPGELARLLDHLLRANVWVFTPTCWKRAIILHRYLALNGTATSIVFGVRQSSERILDGHSWLEIEGKPFLEASQPDHLVTYIFPEPAAQARR
jgi:hypothetical protein